MSLENLLGILLEAIDPDTAAIHRLLRAADRNIADAHVSAISLENRFDAAYKAIMQLANAGLQATGFRTLTSKPGHHQTMIQTLTLTVGVDKKTVVVLDALRKQRNGADYSGDPVSETAVRECIAHAEDLFHEVREWVEKKYPGVVR